MMVIVRRMERAILNQAQAIGLPQSSYQSLLEDRNYGSPASFWSNAKSQGLTTDQEMEYARRMYGDLWHYRGD